MDATAFFLTIFSYYFLLLSRKVKNPLFNTKIYNRIYISLIYLLLI